MTLNCYCEEDVGLHIAVRVATLYSPTPIATCSPNTSVTMYLHGKFPNKWFGRNRLMVWSHRSPDLTALNFF
jgi:hypothetical protein